MKKWFIGTVLIVLVLMSGCCDEGDVRLVEMEDGTYLIEECLSGDWYPIICSTLWDLGLKEKRHFDNENEACEKFNKLIDSKEAIRRGQTVKRIVKCGENNP